MLSAFANALRIGDLRRKLLFTAGMVVVYRVGAYLPTPGIDGHQLAAFFEEIARTQGGTLLGIMNLFSGGALDRATIFALGIMPYVTSSIILQLLTAVIPALERLAKEPEGRKAILQYTRYGTVALALLQSFFIALWLEDPARFGGRQIVLFPGWAFRLLTVITLTSGTAFIMWLGERITERGLGNGISLIITAGIVASIPSAVDLLVALASPLDPSTRQLDPPTLVLLAVMMVAVVVFVIVITQGQRKIPVQYAKRIVGRRVYGGQQTYIPLRVNHAGVIPIIFAQSIILFPQTIASFVPSATLQSVASSLFQGQVVYTVTYAALIVFFCYFYTAITLNPVELADNMKKYGGFVPGIRPGKTTADFFYFVMNRITLAGGVFLALIAILPDIISRSLKVPYLVASFFGGTGLLIIVGVMLDTMKQVESYLLTRHYEGFIKRGRIRARR